VKEINMVTAVLVEWYGKLEKGRGEALEEPGGWGGEDLWRKFLDYFLSAVTKKKGFKTGDVGGMKKGAWDGLGL